MPAARSASYLCERARVLSGILEREGRHSLVAGFAGDIGIAERPILPELNHALALFGQAGFVVGDVTIPTVVGTMYYTIPTTTAKILDITYNDSVGGTGYKSLVQITLTELNQRVHGVPSATAPRIPNVFIPVGGQQVGIWPPPNGVGPLLIKGEAAPADLVLPTDTPTNLPVVWHEALAIFAAYSLVMGGGVPNGDEAENRKSALLSLWNAQGSALTDVIDLRASVHRENRMEGGEQ